MSNVIKFPDNDMIRFLNEFGEVEAALIDALHNKDHEFNDDLARLTMSALLAIMSNYYHEEGLVQDVYSMIRISYEQETEL